MIRPIMCVRDIVAGVFGQPFFPVSVGAGIRQFQDVVNDSSKDNQIFHHPKDFDLYEIGLYDDSDGSVAPISPVRMVARAVDFKQGE